MQRNTNDFILSINYFDPILPNYLLSDTNATSSSTSTQYNLPSRVSSLNETVITHHSNVNSTGSSLAAIGNGLIDSLKQISLSVPPISIVSEHVHLIKKAKLLKTNDSFRSYLFVYPKSLRYDQQKVFSKSRNILVRTELREHDANHSDDSQALRCIVNLNKSFLVSGCPDENVFSSHHLTQITHHNKNPQFYDEIKLLLPLNLNEKHHLLFKFYHVSCTHAKSCQLKSEDMPFLTNDTSSTNSAGLQANAANSKPIETLIGFAWLPIFKNGRLINGEKQLPVAQNLASDYLSFEHFGLGQTSCPADIKWVDGIKPLFKLNLMPLSTIHTTVSF